MALVELTETQWMLLSLLINNALKEIFDKIGNMSEDEVRVAIEAEITKKESLIDRLNDH